MREGMSDNPSDHNLHLHPTKFLTEELLLVKEMSRNINEVNVLVTCLVFRYIATISL